MILEDHSHNRTQQIVTDYFNVDLSHYLGSSLSSFKINNFQGLKKKKKKLARNEPLGR